MLGFRTAISQRNGFSVHGFSVHQNPRSLGLGLGLGLGNLSWLMKQTQEKDRGRKEEGRRSR